MKKIILLSLMVIGLFVGCKNSSHLHVWDAGKVTSVPTCSSVGVKVFTCSDCLEHYTEILPQLEHDWNGNVLIERPTCQKTGYQLFVCNKCDDSKMVLLEKMDHDYRTVETIQEADCVTEGLESVMCIYCFYQYERVIPKDNKNHKSNSEGVWSGDEDCTSQYFTYNCSDCGESVQILEKHHKNVIQYELYEGSIAGNALFSYIVCENCRYKEENQMPDLYREVNSNECEKISYFNTLDEVEAYCSNFEYFTK